MLEVLLELMSAKQILSSRIASEALSKAVKGDLYPSGVGQLHIRDPTKIVPVIELPSKYGATANEAKLHLKGRTLWPLVYKRLASDREQCTRFLDIRARSRTHRRPKNSSYQGRDGKIWLERHTRDGRISYEEWLDKSTAEMKIYKSSAVWHEALDMSTECSILFS
jgi:hypothetical protein